MEVVDVPLDFAGRDGRPIAGRRIGLRAVILVVEYAGGVAVLLIVGECGPALLHGGEEGRHSDRVRVSLSPALGVPERRAVLVAPQEAEVDGVNLGYFADFVADDLNGESTAALQVHGELADDLAGGVSPLIQLRVGLVTEEDVVAGDVVRAAVDDGAEGGDGVVELQEIVRVGVPGAPSDAAPLPGDGALLRRWDVPLDVGVDGGEGHGDPARGVSLRCIVHIRRFFRIGRS